MKLIFKARDISEAHIVSGLLNANDIETHVGGHYLQGGIGGLAAMEFATIFVADEDIDAANIIIAEYENNIKAYKKNPQKNKVKHSSIFITPLIILIISILMMLILAIIFNDYQ